MQMEIFPENFPENFPIQSIFREIFREFCREFPNTENFLEIFDRKIFQRKISNTIPLLFSIPLFGRIFLSTNFSTEEGHGEYALFDEYFKNRASNILRRTGWRMLENAREESRV